ncbi:Hypothetical protein NTJ_03658 [Nesidiocoris tenuis]|uniref:BTB domain-containing protein n=2 Tax=Nesidiocoris tenuis TaxID=355587 RepID=A0ABN7AF27_9HEMI|nr:Hypothetical protein NTJ_03658 [Nesidiocoris tenuis]
MGDVMAEPTMTSAGTTQTSGPVFFGGDITIVAGAGDDHRTFRARRDLLTDQSDYFRSLFLHEQSDNGDGQNGRNADVLIPNVSPEIFGKILNFVETGRLDLTPENIYAVLLAAHLLHMPRALEICRTYLVFERHRLLSTPPPPPPPSIVKPIPSRKYYFWPPPPPPPPAYFSLLPAVPPSHYAATLYAPGPPLPMPSLDVMPSTSIAPPTTREPAFPAAKTPPLTMTTMMTSASAKKSSVYKDIACCDGPVRFKRVLNENYGAGESLDRRTPPPAPAEKPADDGRRSGRRSVFVCRFCKHTFKSHYCFRKHTRRHLNPVTLDATIAVPPASAPVVGDENDVVKDMNVQYYPCKTCGSKFPSYYFVHKHRKICHGADNSNDNDGKTSPTSLGADENRNPPGGGD